MITQVRMLIVILFSFVFELYLLNRRTKFRLLAVGHFLTKYLFNVGSDTPSFSAISQRNTPFSFAALRMSMFFAPDITVLEKFADYFKVSADYLLGRTNAQTQKAKLQAVCNYTGLSDKAVGLLAELKENSPAQLRAVNFLLEQAAGDMDIVYPLDDTDNYEGSILNAVVRYLNRYEGYDDYLADALSSADEGITSEIQSALHQLVLNQTVTALKKGVRGMIDVLYEDTKAQE